MSFSYANALRSELSARNLEYAKAHALAHHVSIGREPVVCYEAGEDVHGNFLPASYRAIVKNDNWRSRLKKPHTAAARVFVRDGVRRKELDSGTSSDALLMNVFCYPGTLREEFVIKLLGIEPGAELQFGYRARVPLANGRVDRTEVDMRLGDLLVEAKLTESDFQKKAKAVVKGYRDFEVVFESESLPQSDECYLSYQLIRNVLAAHSGGRSFCVMIDERRPDLREQWYAVMRCIRVHDLRMRCRMVTWQELGALVPARLGKFLHDKYGIRAPRARHC
jgi:Restriction Endonuclease associating with ARP